MQVSARTRYVEGGRQMSSIALQIGQRVRGTRTATHAVEAETVHILPAKPHSNGK